MKRTTPLAVVPSTTKVDWLVVLLTPANAADDTAYAVTPKSLESESSIYVDENPDGSLRSGPVHITKLNP